MDALNEIGNQTHSDSQSKFSFPLNPLKNISSSFRNPSFKRFLFPGITTLLLMAGLVTSTYLVQQSQDIRKEAAVTETVLTPASVPVKSLPKPITGTFIIFTTGMAFYNASDWNPYFTDLTEMGIDTVVVSAMGCVYRDAPACTSNYKERNYFSSGLMQSFLQAAKAHNKDIYLGLACSDSACVDYKSGDPDDPSTDKGWIIETSKQYAAQAKQFSINSGWGWDGNFIKGFLIPQEVAIPWFVTLQSRFDYFEQIADRIKDLYPSKDILISPYTHDQYSYSEIFEAIRKVARSTRIDIIAPQDSVGTLKITSYNKSRQHFDAIRDAVADKDTEVWANIETFYCPGGCSSNFNVADFKTLRWQIRAASERVTKMITWIHQWSMLTLPTYEPENLSQRLNLRHEYLHKPIIYTAFQWFTPAQLVIKGYNFGNPGESVDIYLRYRNSSDQSFSYNTSSQVYNTGKPFTELRVPMANMPGISLSKLLEIAVVNNDCYTSFYRSQNPESYPDPTFSNLPSCANPISCTSWTNMNINGCSSSEWNSNPKGSDCLTTSTSVNLNLSLANADYMQFANVGSTACANYSGGWSSQETYSGNKPWTLSSGLGEKKVCGRFAGPGGIVQCGGKIQLASPTPTPTKKPTPTPTKKPSPTPTNIPIPTRTPTPRPTNTPTPRPTNTPRPTATPTPPAVPGDANGDDDVDIVDYSIWIDQYLNYNPAPNSNPDFNSDGEVDGLDFIIWLNNFPSS